MDLLSLWRILQVVLGIGLVIFVHEAGHFFAARLCKVRVHVFSLGFGPKLFGWRRGDTDYQVAAVPLGGYVRMAGEESHYSGRPAEPYELGAKTVGQRFFIYSAGVLMNVAFGLVVFPILFTVGIPSIEPIIGQVEPGSPCWSAGLERGSRILEVNGEAIYDLDQLAPEVAYGGTGPVRLLVLPPGADTPSALSIKPTFDETYDIYSIGQIAPAWSAGLPLVVARGSAAERAGVRAGDRLLGVPGSNPGLTPDEALARAVERQEPFNVRVERAGEPLEFWIEPRAGKPTEYALVGFTSPWQHLIALRANELTQASGLALEDRVLAVEGRPILRPGDLLEALTATEGPVEWRVRRDGEERSWESPALSLAQGIQLARDLALTYDQESTQIVVLAGSAAEAAGLATLDEILEVDDATVSRYADLVAASKRAAETRRPLTFALRREGSGGRAPQFLEIQAAPAPLHPLESGLSLSYATYTYRVAGAGRALRLGVSSSFKMIHDVWRHLRGMMRREVGSKNVGSIIKISIVAHDTAKIGWVKFFWFLCLLSMNLAFINVLPIPILDGGHLFFLIIEKLKGSPVSERIFSYSQLVGLVLIVSIFVFVIYNDISTQFFN
jgi:regulator of sigma E protease